MILRAAIGVALFAAIMAAPVRAQFPPLVEPAYVPPSCSPEVQFLSFTSEHLGDATMPYGIFVPAQCTSASRCPVLFVLHGHEDESNKAVAHKAWSGCSGLNGRGTAIVADAATLAAAGIPIVVVFVQGDRSWYTRYVDDDGTKDYESYVVQDLIEHIEATHPVGRDRRFRAIAGNSMGGHGAMKLAAQHPDVFAAASSLSGVLNLTATACATCPVLEEIGNRVQEANQKQVFGPYPGTRTYWEGNNSFDLAENFASFDTQGRPVVRVQYNSGLLDAFLTQTMVPQMDARLDLLGVPHDSKIVFPDPPWDNEGVQHSWKYWDRHMREDTLPFVAETFYGGMASNTPETFQYKTIYKDFDVFGWKFARSDATSQFWGEFVHLVGVGLEGFEISGAGAIGSLDVRTAPLFDPHATYTVSASSAVGAQTLTVQHTGKKLRFTVPLSGSGPAYPVRVTIAAQ